LQRHAEGAMRMMVQSFAGVIESYKEQVNAQKALISDFQKQSADNFRLQEELASRRIEQDLVLREREAQLQIAAAREAHEIEKSQLVWSEGLKQLFQWGPVILHYLTKGEVGQSPESAMTERQREAEEKLFATATDAHVVEWRKQLTPEQFSALLERYRAFRASREHAPSNERPTAQDQRIATAAAALYRELQSRADALEPLAAALVEARSYDDLHAEEKCLVDEIAAGVSAGDGDVSGQALWLALAQMDLPTLLPLVGLLKVGTPWASVDADSKLKLMTLAAKALRTSTSLRRHAPDARA
jgi:hypothetical protein